MKFTIAAMCACVAMAQNDRPRDLTQASLEELMTIEVTSASKKAQSLSKTAASVFVITAEDIRRSGMNSLPEVLRLAPGVQVARTESGTWAVGIRGFNDDFANKLLVLLDGRSVYNELYGGVFWQLLRVPLEDIERIEVIRGPVAAMWGANAVNGVINIISKSASETLGGMIHAETGSEKESTAGARFGGSLGSRAFYRVSARYSDHDPLTFNGRPASPNDWSNSGADIRLDWNPGSRDHVSVIAQEFLSAIPHPVVDPSPANPFPATLNEVERSHMTSIFGRWQHAVSESSDFEVRGSVTWARSGDFNIPATYRIADIDVQHRFMLGGRNEVLWGINLRDADYDVTPQPTFSVTPASSARDRATFFAEDEISIVPDKLSLIGAAQVSWDLVSGRQIQPSARLLWTPTSKLVTWAGVSRAVHTMSLNERGFDGMIASAPIHPGLAGIIELKGDPKLESDPMIAYEAGQRVAAGKRASFDFSAFYNIYHRTDCDVSLPPYFVPPSNGAPAYLDIPLAFSDSCRAHSYGAELSATWNASKHWRLIGGYSWLDVHVHGPQGTTTNAPKVEGSSPAHQFSVRSEIDLTRRFQFDSAIYHYAAMPAIGVPQYTRGDARLGWIISHDLELSAGIQDAFRPDHTEFFSTRVQRALAVHRNIYAKLIWRF